MNKKLITLAVAAAMTAPAAALAEATLYGKVHVSLDYADVNNVILPTYQLVQTPTGAVLQQVPGTGEDFTGWGMSSGGYIPGVNRASRVGVKGSEDLGNGLKAIYQIEFGVNLNDAENFLTGSGQNGNVVNNADSITYRNSFVGLAGSFGTALMGRHDTPMKISTGKLDLFADTMADYNGTVGFRDLRADNVVAYISPSWSGFQFAGAIVPAGGATAGAGENLNADSIAEAYSLAAIYSNGPFYASVAYESLGDELFNDTNTSLYGSNCPYQVDQNGNVTEIPYSGVGGYGCDYNSSDSTAWRVGLGLLDWNGFSLTGIYEARDDEPGSSTYIGFTSPQDPTATWYIPGAAGEVDLWQIQAAYAFGNNTIKAMYGQADYSADYSAGVRYISNNGGPIYTEQLKSSFDYGSETWAVGFDHNFSKRTRAYVLYTEVDDDRENYVAGTEWSGFSLGMIHSF